MKIITTLLLSTLIISQSLNAARTCQDYIADEWPDTRYTIEDISGDNVVTDKKTGLMWKQCSEGLTGLDCMTGAITKYTWQQAVVLPTAQNTTGFAGFTDWRLPNVEELRSIAAINCVSPAINETAFPNVAVPYLYWSSSPYAYDGNKAWTIFFGSGSSGNAFRGNEYRVRLVRSGL